MDTPVPPQIQTCSSCHGQNGISTDRTIPNLAGQLKNYIFSQLQAFKDKKRSSPDSRNVMQIFAGTLSEPEMLAVADYFSSQPGPDLEPEDSSVLGTGQSIFEKGIPDRDVPACMGCHGPMGLGFKAFPRLAGQHASYIANQFRWFISGDRPSLSLMPQIAQKLTPEEVHAVGNYLQSIKEDPNSEF